MLVFDKIIEQIKQSGAFAGPLWGLTECSLGWCWEPAGENWVLHLEITAPNELQLAPDAVRKAQVLIREKVEALSVDWQSVETSLGIDPDGWTITVEARS